MKNPKQSEVDDTINILISYQERLKNEFVEISKKLKMPPEKIEKSLESNQELKKIELTLEKLIKQRESYK